MKNKNVLEFAGRDVISDLLTALLRSGAQQLIAQPVEAELEELLGQHSDRRTDDCNAAVAPKWSFTRARSGDRVGSCDGQNSKSSLQDRRTRDLFVRPCSTLCAQDKVSGGSIAMAIFEGPFGRRDGLTCETIDWP